MGPEGNIFINSPISTFQQGLTHSAMYVLSQKPEQAPLQLVDQLPWPVTTSTSAAEDIVVPMITSTFLLSYNSRTPGQNLSIFRINTFRHQKLQRSPVDHV